MWIVNKCLWIFFVCNSYFLSSIHKQLRLWIEWIFKNEFGQQPVVDVLLNVVMHYFCLILSQVGNIRSIWIVIYFHYFIIICHHRNLLCVFSRWYNLFKLLCSNYKCNIHVKNFWIFERLDCWRLNESFCSHTFWWVFYFYKIKILF